jgi:mono/diheme cytochrome c family protein
MIDRFRLMWSAPVCAALVCCATMGLNGPLDAQDVPALPQDVQAGSRVFGSKGCVSCHAVRGLGGSTAPDLARLSRTRSLNEFVAAIWNHLPQMAAQMGSLGVEAPRMRPAEVGNLVAFLFWLDYLGGSGDTVRGKALFVNKQCIVCHQVRGVGGVVGPNLDILAQFVSPLEVAADMWNHGPAMAEQMRARSLRRPTFTGGELRDLAAYLESTGQSLPSAPLHVLPGVATRGASVFEDRGCVECHRAGGRRVAPDLATRPYGDAFDFAAAMWNKEPAMTRAMTQQGVELPTLEAGAMADLVAYLYLGRNFGDAGNSARGRRLLQAKGCLGCHTLRGRGGQTAGDLDQVQGVTSSAAAVAALWNHVALTALAETPAAGAWTEITAQDAADLIAVLQQLGGSE